MEEFIILKAVFQKLSNTKSAFKRFSIPMVLSILCALFFSMSLDFKSSDLSNIRYMRMGYFFFLGIFLYTFVMLFERSLKNIGANNEELKKNKLLRIFIYISTIPIMYGVYGIIYSEGSSFFEYEDKYIYFGLLLSLIVGISFIAKIKYHKDFVSYVANIFSDIITAFIYSAVAFIGIAVIVFATSNLFNLNFQISVYTKIGFFIFIPFNLGIILSNFPKAGESFNDYDFSKALKVLISYILIPICMVYSMILFAYFLKVIILNEIPRGIIVHLVLWFGIVSVFIIFFATKINVKFVNEFRKIFPCIMMPNLFIMFYSIYLRVNQYGLTENRYLIIIMGIWVLFSYIYYIGYRKNSNIAIPISLAILILFSSVGPVSAYNLTRKSQNTIFLNILSKNSMVNGNKIVPTSEISKKDKRNITEIVEYMDKYHRVNELSYIDENFKFNSENMKRVFGFEPELKKENEDLIYYVDANISIDITGYNKLLRISSLSDEQIIGKYKFIRDGANIKIIFLESDGETLIANIKMEEILDKLSSLKKSNAIINPEDLAIIENRGKIKYKIIFNEISFTSKDNPKDFFVDFYLMTDMVE